MKIENTDQLFKKPEEHISLGIPDAAYPDAGQLIAELLKLKGTSPVQARNRPQSGDVQIVEVIPPSIAKMMALVATNAWSLKEKMTNYETDEPKDNLKRLYHHVERILDSLSGVGLKISDRTGQIFDYGLPEKVVATQPRPGTNKEFVIQTIKPTIFFNNHIIQQGEVVIATPEAEKATNEPTP